MPRGQRSDNPVTRYFNVELYLTTGQVVSFETSRFEEIVNIDAEGVAIPGSERFTWAKREGKKSPMYINRDYVALVMIEPVMIKGNPSK